jgi:tetratricopeptide (TPR) repeat protein
MGELVDVLVSAPRRARTRLLGLVGGLGVAAAAGSWLVASQDGPSTPPCAGMESRLRGVWDDTRRDSVVRSLERLPADFVKQSSDRITRRFDDWSGRWLEERRDACLATRVRQEQSEATMDARIACYDRQLQHLQARVEVLEQLEPDQAANAARLAAALPSPLDCRDPRSRRRPDDPSQRKALERAEAQLARAEAEERAGRYVQAGKAAEAALEAAELSRDARARAEAKRARGSALMESGEYDAAIQALEEAYFLALSEDIPQVQALSAGLLSFIGSEHGRKEAQEARWQAHGQALLLRELPPLVEASLQLNLGAVAYRAKDFDGARQYYEAALQTRREQLGDEDPEVAMVLNNLANAQQRLENLDLARSLHEEALSIRERSLGPDHPDTAMSHNNLGSVLKRQKDYSAAFAHLGRAIAIKKRALGDAHPSLGIGYLNLASAQLEAEAYSASLESAVQAETRLATSFGETHIYRAWAFDTLGRAQYGLENWTAAERGFRDALAIAVENEHAEADSMRVRVAQALAKQDRVSEARAVLREIGRPLTPLERETLSIETPQLAPVTRPP